MDIDSIVAASLEGPGVILAKNGNVLPEKKS
jgi:hypothetical protein